LLLNNIIHILRRKKNIKQVDLAKDLNVSPSYLCKVEKGLINPSEMFKKKCSDIFNVEIDVIFSDNSKSEEKIKTVNLPNNLWSARQGKKLKQHKLAEMIGCSPSYLSKVEKGIQSPNEKFMKKCARVLRIKVSELFPG